MPSFSSGYAGDDTQTLDREGLVALFASRFQVDSIVHVVVVGTKPDIIKQYPIYKELVSRGEQVLLCHSGQHTDFAYSGGMLLEFGIEVDIRLTMSGAGLGEKVSSLISQASTVFEVGLEQGYTLIPYIHGDTATSMGFGVAAYLNRVACVHVEAGIRTLTPAGDFFERHFQEHVAERFNWPEYAAAHRHEATFTRGSSEPYPEQFNTRVSDAASGFHAAPVELVRRFLIEEGYEPSTIAVVGNTVVDATLEAKERAAVSRIFERYPDLASGKFVRVCVHRRENTHDEQRFRCYFGAVEELLDRGHPILWVLLNGTKWALDRWGLADRLASLVAKHGERLIVSDVWPEYTDVIAAFMSCAVVATDSGSMQEEANILGVPCVTLRFGSDRGESLLAGGNVLAPPLSPEFVASVVEGAVQNRHALIAESIYGTDCARLLVSEVLARAKLKEGVFQTEEQRLFSRSLLGASS